MLNIYSVEKKLKDFESRANRTTRQGNWEAWKERRSDEWLQNYRRRVEKFVVDVDENSQDYDFLLNQRKAAAASDTKCVGPSHFIFRPYKSEKERVRESVEKNKCFETEPISRATQTHQFRDRDRSKEIASDMRFSSDPSRNLKMLSKGNAGVIRETSSHLNSPWGDNNRDLKLYFKSTLSMLLRLGVLQSRLPVGNDIEENAMIRYERLAEENRQKRHDDADKLKNKLLAGKDKAKDGGKGAAKAGEKKQDDSSDLERKETTEREENRVNRMDVDGALHLARKLLMKAMSITGFCYLPKIAKRSDPIQTAAEKILVKTNYIHKIRRYKRRMGESRYKGCAPPVDLAKLSKKLNL